MNGDLHARFGGQMRLREIGEGGQALLLGARVDLTGHAGLEREVEGEYLVRAGVGEVLTAPQGLTPPFAHEGAFTDAAACAVGAGAWRALASLRRLLGVEA